MSKDIFIIKPNKEGTCWTCRKEYDERYVNSRCPECGAQYREDALVDIQNLAEESTEFITSAKKLDIPAHYFGLTWSKGVLEKDKGGDKLLKPFQDYVQQLCRVHDIFERGDIPNKSALIIAPMTYSKVTWAYSCMQCAIAHGHSVTPLLDTVELKRFFVISAEKPNYKMMGMTYEEYIEKDICFLTVTKSEYVSNSWQTIIDILDKRSRKGLPTFIISRYGIEAISKWDMDGQFIALFEQGGHRNPLKYPTLVSYSKTL